MLRYKPMCYPRQSFLINTGSTTSHSTVQALLMPTVVLAPEGRTSTIKDLGHLPCGGGDWSLVDGTFID